MTQRNRPGQATRIGHELATAVLRGAPRAEAEALAKKLLDKEAADRARRDEYRSGNAALYAFRHGDRR